MCIYLGINFRDTPTFIVFSKTFTQQVDHQNFSAYSETYRTFWYFARVHDTEQIYDKSMKSTAHDYWKRYDTIHQMQKKCAAKQTIRHYRVLSNFSVKFV